MANDFTRHVAVKSNIANLLSSEYIKGEDGQADYFLGKNKEKIFRLNLMAIVVSSSKTGSITNLLVDDGTERIVLRFFEEQKGLEEIQLGDTITCIGKLRMYNNEKYIAPEICKKIDPLWLKVRNIELEKGTSKIVQKGTEVIREETEEVKEEIIDFSKEIIEEASEKLEKPLSQLILEKIKELDTGDGVFIEDLIEKIEDKDTEKVLERMLETGDIFQNLPGRVKIL